MSKNDDGKWMVVIGVGVLLVGMFGSLWLLIYIGDAVLRGR